jgi:hypothetical protein
MVGAVLVFGCRTGVKLTDGAANSGSCGVLKSPLLAAAKKPCAQLFTARVGNLPD